MEDLVEICKPLMWILFVGSVAAQGTSLASWYQGHFANALVALGITSLTGSKRALIEFLWVDGPCDVYLEEIWKLRQVGALELVLDGDQAPNGVSSCLQTSNSRF